MPGQQAYEMSRQVLRELGPSPRLVVVKAGGLGDFLAATPALRALRGALPQAHLTLIAKPDLVSFCQRYALLDRVLPAPPYPGISDPPYDEVAADQFLRQMRQERLDLALQWQGNGMLSNRFVRGLGARITAGFRSAEAPGLDFWLPFDSRQHEALRFLDLVRLLGVEPVGLHLELPIIDRDEAELANLDGKLDKGALEGRQYLGLQVSAGGRSRQWPPERFAEVANHLLVDFPLAGVVVSAGPGQEGQAAATLAQIRPSARKVDVSGCLSLGGLAALISRLRLLISTDSGPAHMAVALGTPSVTVFGSGNPLNWAPLARTWHRAVVNWAAPCRWQVDDGCPEDPSVPCLQGVGAAEVVEEASSLLNLLTRMR